MEKICDRCGVSSNRLFSSFGKRICADCRNNRPNKGTGNSGMNFSGQSQICWSSDSISLELVKKSNPMFGGLFVEHYPGSIGIVGRSLNYLIWKDGLLAGIISGSSPPKNYKIFVNYFNGADERHYLNNNVFRLIINERNLGTKILKEFRRIIKVDYERKFGDVLLGICTFVEMPRDGALYKADNWDYLGVTQGKRMYRRGENWEKQFVEGEKKHIFAFRYKIKERSGQISEMERREGRE